MKNNIEKENNEMLRNQIKEAQHHSSELKAVVSTSTQVEPWVVAKMERATTDLSDIAHYLDGRKDMKMATGGLTPSQEEKVGKVMHEFKEGKLHSGSKQGPVVTERKQAIAIALAEANAMKMKKGGKIVGYLKSKKPVYEETMHPSHSYFTSQEHKEAAKLLRKQVANENPMLNKPLAELSEKYRNYSHSAWEHELWAKTSSQRGKDFGSGSMYKDGGDIEDTGLMIKGRTQKDNTTIGEILDENGFEAEWSAREGHWFIPVDVEDYDDTESQLTDLFDENDVKATIEGIFKKGGSMYARGGVIKNITKQLDELGVKYTLSKSKVRLFDEIIKPTGKNDSFYDKFDRIIDLYNLQGIVKTKMSTGGSMYKDGGNITQEQFEERTQRALKNLKYDGDKILVDGKQIGSYKLSDERRAKYKFFYAFSVFPNVDSGKALTRKLAVKGLIQNVVAKGLLYNDEMSKGGCMYKAGGTIKPGMMAWKENKSYNVIRFDNDMKRWVLKSTTSGLEIMPKESELTSFDFMNAKMETGGVAAMSTVNEIARLTGLRGIAVAEWGDKNNINLTVILKDLKSKKIKGIDLMTAIVGRPNNKYSKQLLATYSKMENGGGVNSRFSSCEKWWDSLSTDQRKKIIEDNDLQFATTNDFDGLTTRGESELKTVFNTINKPKMKDGGITEQKPKKFRVEKREYLRRNSPILKSRSFIYFNTYEECEKYVADNTGNLKIKQGFDIEKYDDNKNEYVYFEPSKMATGGGVEKPKRKKFILYSNPNNSTNTAYVAIGEDVKEVLSSAREYPGSYTILYKGTGTDEDLQKAKAMYSNYRFSGNETIMETGGPVEGDLTNLSNLERYVNAHKAEIKANRKTYGFMSVAKITNPYDLSSLLGVDSRIFRNAEIPYYAKFVASLLK